MSISIFFQKTGLYMRKFVKIMSRINLFFFNVSIPTIWGFFGRDTCEKLIWTSGQGRIITNKISKIIIPKTYINKIYPSSTFSFLCYPHKNTCDILSEYFISSIFQAYSSKNLGILFRYTMKVKSIHSIGILTTCEYQHCGEK